ncbi:uncharacterized protein LOC143517587 [Brachyhypopomus gauderio]|uniref:uncharacterized protein LOC143517587 n=1 Tax=Brachyhypopomus gauderio TaxID=698409 RepID=UPI0040413746
MRIPYLKMNSGLILCICWVFTGKTLSSHCSAMKENITFDCAEIHNSKGFTYPVPSDVPPANRINKHCMQSWYNQDSNLLAEGGNFVPNDEVWDPLVTAVTPDNLTTSRCVDGIFYIMECHEFQYKHTVTYHAMNDTIPAHEELEHLGYWLHLLLLVIAVVLLILMLTVCYCNRQWIRDKVCGV